MIDDKIYLICNVCYKRVTVTGHTEGMEFSTIKKEAEFAHAEDYDCDGIMIEVHKFNPHVDKSQA